MFKSWEKKADEPEGRNAERLRKNQERSEVREIREEKVSRRNCSATCCKEVGR